MIEYEILMVFMKMGTFWHLGPLYHENGKIVDFADFLRIFTIFIDFYDF